MPRLLFAIAAALFVASCNEPPTDYRECPPGVDPGSFDCVFPRPERDTGAPADADTSDVRADDDDPDAHPDAAPGDNVSEGTGAQEESGQVDIEPVDSACAPGDDDCPRSN